MAKKAPKKRAPKPDALTLEEKVEAIGTTLHLLSKRFEEIEKRIAEFDFAHAQAGTEA